MSQDQRESDPVHQDANGGWYFWDETGADRIGPFPSERAARKAMSDYVEQILSD